MKINISNVSAMEHALSVAQNGARVRTINVHDIGDALQDIEQELQKILPKKEWVGISVAVDMHARKFPNSYKGVPASTVFTVERFPSGWFITSLRRERCATKVYSLRIDASKANSILRHVRDTFGQF